MKVLALNGSPRMKASSTYHMLKPLIEGMEAAGAEVDLLHIRKLDLKACIGCYTCWVRTPGQCIHKDSMTEAIKLYNEADLVIFGTPLYHFSMSGIMKTFIDRTLPRIEPWLIPHPDIPDVTFHPERFHKPSKIMLVSPCGFPEFTHFESLVATFKQMAHMERMEYVGEILRPGAEALSRRELQGMFADYYDLLRQAGTQIITDNAITPDLQTELRQDLFPGGKQAFYDMAGAYWTQQMDRFNVPDEKRRMVVEEPLPTVETTAVSKPKPAFTDVGKPANPIQEKKEMIDINSLNCHDTIAGMPTVFNAEVAGELTAVIQFRVTGEEPGDYYLQITDGACTFNDGIADAPTMTISTPSQIWLAVSRGELDGQMAFMQQKYTVEGDFSLLLKMNTLFKT